MLNLKDKLDDARAEVDRLERAIKSATCAEAGHDWFTLGGSNAGCNPDCICSVPVFECKRCGACDYGFNEEARLMIIDCELRNGPWEDSTN